MKIFKKATAFVTALLSVVAMNQGVLLNTNAALPFELSCYQDEFMVGDDGTVNFYCYNAYGQGGECEIELFQDSMYDVVLPPVSYMYDDGDPEHGDRKANDGIYSCKIQIDTSYSGVYYYYAVNATADSNMVTGSIEIRVLDEFTEEDQKIMQEVNQQLDNFNKKAYAEGIGGEDYYNAMIELLNQLQNDGLIESYVPKGYFDDVDGITFYYHTGKKGKTPPEIICVIPTETQEPIPTESTPLPTEMTEPTQNNNQVYFSGIYQYVLNDTGITITACDRDVTGELIVPDEIDGKTVTAIGEHAFYACATVNQIVLPDTVQEIGKQAFAYCYNLEAVNIPDGVPAIGDETFLMCRELKAIDLPESVTSIGVRAFTECQNLIEVQLPEDVRSIGSEAFQNCSSLEKINIPHPVSEIADNTFLGCKSLKEMILFSNVSKIGKCAFMLCNLETLLIDNYDCEIDESFATMSGSRDTVIYGYTGSTAQAFAEEYGYQFNPLETQPEPTDPTETTESTDPTETTEPTEIIIPWWKLKFGDLDNNDEVDILDVIIINKAILGKEELLDEQKKLADVDMSGAVDPNDSLYMMKKIVGLVDHFPAEEVDYVMN